MCIWEILSSSDDKLSVLFEEFGKALVIEPYLATVVLSGTLLDKSNYSKKTDLIEKICDPVIVMAEGSVLFEGSVEDAKKDEKVIESYLGRGSKLKDN